MSSRSLPVDLSRRAQRDLRVILARTREEWGDEQEAIYAEALRRALLTLGDFPESGRSREELGPGYRSLVVEQHILFYQVEPRRVTVVRILHGRMDARRALRGRP
jgi:toxin ParE1/3/4